MGTFIITLRLEYHYSTLPCYLNYSRYLPSCDDLIGDATARVP